MVSSRAELNGRRRDELVGSNELTLDASSFSAFCFASMSTIERGAMVAGLVRAGGGR